MEFRSTNQGFCSPKDIQSNVGSSHGVHLQGGSTAVVTACADDAAANLKVHGKGTGGVMVGSASTTPVALVQRYLVQFTVPALSSGASAESTVTVTGLTTNSVLVLQPRAAVNSTVTGVQLSARCVAADELTVGFHNVSVSSLSGSTNSAYLLQFSF